MKLDRIVLTTDLSDCSRRAYPAACALARRHGAEVILLHAMTFPVQPTFIDVAGPQLALEDVRRGIVESVTGELARPEFEDVQARSQVIEGYGPGVVCEFARDAEADLIVQASHGYRGIQRFVLGSFAERVLHLADLPVLTIREDAGETVGCPRHLLVPHDLTELSDPAVEAARFLARSTGARITLLHVVQTFPGWPEASRRHLNESAIDGLREIAEKTFPDLEVDTRVLEGDPAETIQEFAAELDVDLVCMATHSWSLFHHLLLGSVTEKVVRQIEIPLLTVHPPPEVRERAPAKHFQPELLP